jgi:uroporphyrinogen-III synthase
VVPAGPFDALLFTSARAPEHVAQVAPELLPLSAGAVGARTKESAEAVGFRVDAVGDRDGTAILAAMAANGARRVLHLAGEATAPLTVPDGVELVRVPVYAAERVGALAPEAAAGLRTGAVFATLLFSARTARHFRTLVEEAGLPIDRLRIVALSAAVAEAAGPGWAAAAVAGQPDLAAHLSAAHGLWQGVRDGRPSHR